ARRATAWVRAFARPVLRLERLVQRDRERVPLAERVVADREELPLLVRIPRRGRVRVRERRGDPVAQALERAEPREEAEQIGAERCAEAETNRLGHLPVVPPDRVTV